MIKLAAISTVLAAVLFSTDASWQEKPQEAPTTKKSLPAARPEDVSTIDGIVKAVYDVISGPAGQKRDWERDRSLYTANARLIGVGMRDGKVRYRDMSVEDYAKMNGPYLEKEGFFEREVARKEEVFGHVAHVFSTYESRMKADDPKPFQRGINSIQLLNDGKRWWVTSIIWDAETDAQPIPEKYLK